MEFLQVSPSDSPSDITSNKLHNNNNKGNIQKLRSGFFASRDTKGGEGGQSGGKKDTKVFLKSVFFKNHIESF